jgi:peptidoglycan/LPS O-acetylase OafA/YrhL
MSAPAASVQTEIVPLTGVRGVACAFVVAYHAYPVLFWLLPGTSGSFNELGASMIAVDFFFMLSGFVIAHNYVDGLGRPTRGRIRSYLVLRVARIWPLHVVMVVAFLLYGAVSWWVLGYGLTVDHSPANVLANLLMAHEFGPFQAINLPAWSMAPEVGAYLAFPLMAPLLLLLAPHRRVLVGVLLVWLGLGTWLLLRGYAELGPGDWSHSIAWLRMGVSFPVGAFLALWWRKLPLGLRHGRAWDLLASVSAVVIVAVALGMNRGEEFREPVILYPLLALLVVSCAGACGPVERFLSWRPVHWSGEVSYAIYLTHFLVIVVFFAVIARSPASEAGLIVRLALLLGLVALVILTGALAHVAVEVPARRRIRSVALPADRHAPGAPSLDTLAG